MMGGGNPQPSFYYKISLESFVPQDHPLRRIRPLIDDVAIRRECRPLYSDGTTRPASLRGSSIRP